MSKPIWCKITNEKEIHNGFQYKDGLNKLEDKFEDDPTATCCKGGLYFTTSEFISDFLGFGCNLRIVELPEDNPEFKMVKDPDHLPPKWRANMIILKEKYDLYDIKTIQKFNIYTYKLINQLFLNHKYDVIKKLWDSDCKNNSYVCHFDGTYRYYTYLEWASKFNRVDGLDMIFKYFTSKKYTGSDSIVVDPYDLTLSVSPDKIIEYCEKYMAMYMWWKRHESHFPRIKGKLSNKHYDKIFGNKEIE